MKKLKVVLYIIFFCIALSPGIKEVIKSFNGDCDDLQEFVQTSFQGIVYKKYIDSSQHSSHTIEIKNFKNAGIQKLTLDFDKTGFFFQINQGDTIYKEVNSDTVYLSDKLGKHLYIINFPCK
jgi:hypothetical protein